MKIKSIILPVILFHLIFITSCSETENYEDAEIVSWESFGDEISLSGEVFLSQDILNPVRILATDSILYLANTNVSKMLQIIDLNKKKVLGEFIPFGSGPEEMINISSIKKKRSYLYLYDMGQLRLNKLTLDNENLLSYSNSIQFNYAFDDIAVISDTSYVALVLDSEMNRLSFFQGGKFEKTVGEYPQISGRTMSGIEKIEGFSSSIVISDDSKRIAIVYMNTDLIEIYDIEGTFIRRIHGPDHFFPEVSIKNIGEYQKVTSESGKSKDAYFSPVPCGDTFAVLYSGKIYNRQKPDYLKEWVLFFDWDGNPVKKYRLDKPIFCLSIDSKYRTIYGITDNPEFQIIKYIY